MKLSIASIALFMALSATASAEEGFYWGIGVGQSYSNLCPGNDATYSCARTGDSFAAIGGYNVTQNLGIEVNYDVLGSYAAYQQGVSSAADGSAIAFTRVNALVAAATGNVKVYKNISLIGKLGIGNFSIFQPVATGTNTATNTNLIYGLGLQYEFTKNVIGRTLWENFGTVGNDATGTSPMSLITFGLIFKY